MEKESNGEKGIGIVPLRGIFDSEAFRNSPSPLTVALGKDMSGNHVVCRLEKMPHLLIAGVVESDISTCLHAMILSLLHKATPDEVRLILVDSEQGTFNAYKGLPHLAGKGVLESAREFLDALDLLGDEMERRYVLFSQYRVYNVQNFNESDAVKSGAQRRLPYIVLIVDELAQFLIDETCRDEAEEKIMRLTQKARAAGIHLVLSTQHPNVDVITGTIKANVPSRIAFAVDRAMDSRIIIDENGAEKLRGKGDMLYAPMGFNDPMRVQGAYVTDREIVAATELLRNRK
ncbi:MAG: hypothetical protein K2M95_06820 [Clostridiales bacterium]|nr:hypothetical protein [Clostridiales bacterium]